MLASAQSPGLEFVGGSGALGHPGALGSSIVVMLNLCYVMTMLQMLYEVVMLAMTSDLCSRFRQVQTCWLWAVLQWVLRLGPWVDES